jgi:phosphoglycolate phosphatase-like HAD superfamily hydrolase
VTKAVLFDLDGTLVDTTAIAAMRDARNWRGSVRSMHLTSLYPGVPELLQELERHRIPWAVVTNVVSHYAEAAFKHHGLACPTLVAYHDVRQRKPHPEGCLKVLAGLKVSPDAAAGVGDLLTDREAFARAGIPAYCATWNPAAEVNGDWTAILRHPRELLPLILK